MWIRFLIIALFVSLFFIGFPYLQSIYHGFYASAAVCSGVGATCCDAYTTVCQMPDGTACEFVTAPGCTCTQECIAPWTTLCSDPIYPNACGTGCPPGSDMLGTPNCYWVGCANGYESCGGCYGSECLYTAGGKSCAQYLAECPPGGGAFCQAITSQEPLSCGGNCGPCQREYWRRDLRAPCPPGNPTCSCGYICLQDPTCADA